MDKKIYILVVEDEPEVLDAIVRDISEFEDIFPIEMADTAEESKELISKLLNEGHEIGLILCDHVLPGQNGVELLVEMQNDERTQKTKKVLVTGQAGLDETIRAVNKAELEQYIAKPWKKETLVEVTRKLLTDYVLENRSNPMAYMQVLDRERIADEIRKGKGITDS